MQDLKRKTINYLSAFQQHLYNIKMSPLCQYDLIIKILHPHLN